MPSESPALRCKVLPALAGGCGLPDFPRRLAALPLALRPRPDCLGRRGPLLHASLRHPPAPQGPSAMLARCTSYVPRHARAMSTAASKVVSPVLWECDRRGSRVQAQAPPLAAGRRGAAPRRGSSLGTRAWWLVAGPVGVTVGALALPGVAPRRRSDSWDSATWAATWPTTCSRQATQWPSTTVRRPLRRRREEASRALARIGR